MQNLPIIEGELEAAMKGKAEMRTFLLVKVRKENRRMMVEPLLKRSRILSSLVDSNGYTIVQSNKALKREKESKCLCSTLKN